mmetsp:Transcript_209/g.608  ORF Transcript_209/g.608 Transcript_209/m.608 type:complete len:208 (+) Transcript_209:1215-1838(+)
MLRPAVQHHLPLKGLQNAISRVVGQQRVVAIGDAGHRSVLPTPKQCQQCIAGGAVVEHAPAQRRHCLVTAAAIATAFAVMLLCQLFPQDLSLFGQNVLLLRCHQERVLIQEAVEEHREQPAPHKKLPKFCAFGGSCAAGHEAASPQSSGNGPEGNVAGRLAIWGAPRPIDVAGRLESDSGGGCILCFFCPLAARLACLAELAHRRGG